MTKIEMGISESEAPKQQHKKWKITGIQVTRASLQPIRITNNHQSSDEDEWRSTTPTSEESRIPDKVCPPPPPRKRKTTSQRGCSYGGSGTGATVTAKEFFVCPPDLETVFIRRHVA